MVFLYPLITRMYKKSIIVSLLLLCTTFTASAQSFRKYYPQYNAWLMYFGSHKVSKHWGVHLEGQWRRANLGLNAQQLLLRTGLNYHFSEQIYGTVGYCFVQTYPYGVLPAASSFPENRIWQQLQIKSILGKLEFVNRFRLEQRWLYAPVSNNGVFESGNAIYTNRFRLLQRFSMPLNGKEITDNTFYVSAYNELFISAGSNVAYNLLDQNRVYGAVGYKIPKLGRLEIGYFQQLIFKSDGVKVENNHTLQIGLTSTLSFN